MREHLDLEQAAQIDPQAIYQEALTLETQGDFTAALRLIELLLQVIPEHVSLQEKRAGYLLYLEEFDKSIDAFRSLQRMEPSNPTYPSNLSIGLARRREFHEAISACKRALVLKPDYGFAYNNLGGVFRELREIERAQILYFRATRVSPHNALFRWGLAIVSLMLGDFEEGWPHYESGFSCGERFPRSFGSPQWTGREDLEGKKLLIHSEQGYGDSIQMVRYLLEPALAQTEVILEIEDALFPLLGNLRSGLKLIKKGDEPPAHDFHCPMMSLPLAFKTGLVNVPDQVPYIRVMPEMRVKWQTSLGFASKLRIGVAWSGNASHKNDHQRSIPLRVLRELFSTDAEFHAIQKDIRPEELAQARATPNLFIHSDELNDFTDTAALIDAMDLIISVDTSVAHLSGALGKPTFLMITYVPDFRWLLNREDSVWYPSFRLFRQTSLGEWSSVVDRVLVALREIRR